MSAIFETDSEAFDNAIGFVILHAGQSLLSLGDDISTIRQPAQGIIAAR